MMFTEKQYRAKFWQLNKELRQLLAKWERAFPAKPQSDREICLDKLLASPAVQAAIARGEVSFERLRKDSTERLKAKWLSRDPII
jgi:FPC/CPF motif-containing protein YcgG